MSTLPLTHVVLFKHGLASLEREGLVTDNQTLHLNLKETEMDNVLKSLTVVDCGGGSISSISYGGVEADNGIISSLLRTGGDLRNLYQELKGINVRVSIGSESIEGILTDFSSLQISLKETRNLLTVFTSESKFVSIDHNSIANFEILDQGTKDRLEKHFKALMASKKEANKVVNICTQGEGERKITICYVTSCPEWKTSYRLIVSDDPQPSSDAGSQDDPPATNNLILQGWALVNNLSEESWENVKMTLISGKPHSLDYKLYDPSWGEEKKAKQPIQHAFQPQYQQQPPPPQQLQQYQPPPQQLQQVPHMQQIMPRNSMARNLVNNVVHTLGHDGNSGPGRGDSAPPASTEEKGDMFSYQIATAVTVEPKHSAFVPIVDVKVTGLRGAIFNEENHGAHPNSAVVFTNTSNLTLEAGPITVFQGGTYVGEAMLPTTQPGQVKFVEFATEVSIDVWSTHSETKKATKCTISHGVMTLKQNKIYTKTYHLRNKSTKDTLVYIEHKFRKDCKLIDTPKPTNPHPIKNYIFKTKAPKSDTVLFKVHEQTVRSEEISLLSATEHKSSLWLSLNYIDANVKDILDKFTELNKRQSQIKAQKNKINKENANIFSNQERLRHNLLALGKSSTEEELRRCYLNEMMEDEKRLKEATKKLDNLDREENENEDKKKALIDQISLSKNV